MSITFNKAALIDAANAALKHHAAAAAEWRAAVADFRKAKAADNDVLSRVRAVRDDMSELIKSRRQPTSEDARRWGRLAGTDYFSSLYSREVSDREIRDGVPKPTGWLGPAREEGYRGLIKLLNAHVEDTITANQLKLVGYTDLESLFRMAATADPETDAPKTRKR